MTEVSTGTDDINTQSEASPTLRAELRAHAQQLQRLEGLVQTFAGGVSGMSASLQNTALDPHYVNELVTCTALSAPPRTCMTYALPMGWEARLALES